MTDFFSYRLECRFGQTLAEDGSIASALGILQTCRRFADRSAYADCGDGGGLVLALKAVPGKEAPAMENGYLLWRLKC